jgi:phosphoribosylformylglycinamidine cyclo-ligase
VRDPYAESGVHLDLADRLVERFRLAASLTARPEVVAGVGGFAGAYRLAGVRRPLLVAATDGVGTKLLLAREHGSLEGLGQDLAAMVLNDLACLGAQPLFFLDYLGVGVLEAEAAERLVVGLARVLAEEGCALLGGETAEMPGLYRPGDFDFVGFAVGVVEEEELLRPHAEPGDVLLALPSSGLHANGFSLVRRILADHPELVTAELVSEILTPTRVYVRPMLALKARLGRRLHGFAHITGGGLPGNVQRILAPGAGARLELRRREPRPMAVLMRAAGLSRAEVVNVWNLGVGLVAAVAEEAAEEAQAALQELGEDPFVVGRVGTGAGVTLT